MRKKSKNRIIIGACYGLSAVNCIVAWLTSLSASSDKDSSIIILGIILLIMIPVSVSDPRAEMQNNFAVCAGIIMHILIDIMVSLFWRYWWILLISTVETIILICLFFAHRQNKKKKKK
ncbi:MAG: hypothetical protein ACI4EG_11760 [Fusicatenibacter sp.]